MSKMPGYPCEVCRRSGGHTVIQREGQAGLSFCSTECARIYMRSETLGVDEEKACKVGGRAAGEYLEGIRKYDLGSLSEKEWEVFCRTMFAATCAEMKRMADDEIPF